MIEFNHSSLDQVMLKDVLPDEDNIVIVPGAFVKAEQVNEAIKDLPWALIFIVADECNLFDLDNLTHPNMRVWVQTPRVGNDYDYSRTFGVGYAYARKYGKTLYNEYMKKPYDVFISGQNTHPRRHEIFAKLYEYGNKHGGAKILETKGFTQGLVPKNYYNNLAKTKIAPAPSGVYSPDSFRVYEALELGCIPIADDLSPSYDSKGYWGRLYPNAPFPILQDSNISKPIRDNLSEFAAKSNQVYAWWQFEKYKLKQSILRDIRELKGSEEEELTVIVPVSPWKSHPDTSKLEETIESIRKHTDANIIVTFDGVRPEQADRLEDYQQFIRKTLWLTNFTWDNVYPLLFTEHQHQSGMAREVLKWVDTNNILYVEGDSPLADAPIDFPAIMRKLETAHIVRLYNKPRIPEEHEYLMQHFKDDGDFIGTKQWSQQPHFAQTEFYLAILEQFFSPTAKCFIEEKMYYIAIKGQYDMYIYKPDDTPRSYHIDGREGEPTYYETQTF